MTQEKSRLYSRLNMAADIILLLLSFLLAYLFIWGHFKPNFQPFFFKVSVALLLCWLFTALLLNLYDTERYKQFAGSLSRFFLAVLFHALLLGIVVILVRDFNVSRVLFIYGYMLFVLLDALLRLLLIYVLREK